MLMLLLAVAVANGEPGAPVGATEPGRGCRPPRRLALWYIRNTLYLVLVFLGGWCVWMCVCVCVFCRLLKVIGKQVGVLLMEGCLECVLPAGNRCQMPSRVCRETVGIDWPVPLAIGRLSHKQIGDRPWHLRLRMRRHVSTGCALEVFYRRDRLGY